MRRQQPSTAGRDVYGTLVERTTLYVALVKLDNGTAQATADGFGTILQRFDRDMRLSLTYDQGRKLDDIAWKLNTRPRKSLGWKYPAELFLPVDAFDFLTF
ncbi:MAG: hypothetical protein ACOH2K_01395 [Burkholderiaceae bacterium]